jgi:hypothetical protein
VTRRCNKCLHWVCAAVSIEHLMLDTVPAKCTYENPAFMLMRRPPIATHPQNTPDTMDPCPALMPISNPYNSIPEKMIPGPVKKSQNSSSLIIPLLRRAHQRATLSNVRAENATGVMTPTTGPVLLMYCPS